MILYPHGRHCNCGLDGCFEQYCSGTALVKRYQELSKKCIQDGYALFEQIKAKDPIAIQVLHEFVEDLSIAMISIANMFDPEIILIGGGLSDTKEVWWDELIQCVSSSALSTIFTPKIIPAKLGNHAGLYGAAYLVFDYLKTFHE